MKRIYLRTTYAERLEVKQLGARWDGEQRQWFITETMDVALFAAWLPDQVPAVLTGSDLATAAKPEQLPATQQGIGLSELLQGVARAVAAMAKDGIWTRLEVTDVKVQRGGHVRLEVSERDAEGTVLAKAQAVIWQGVANSILPQFEAATGMVLSPGLKLLVRARPNFHTQFGFSLVIDSIDPKYSLGDLERKKREIRTRLQVEGLWEQNRQLPAPWDFNRLLVIAPDQAAGLGDFRAEADRLQHHGLCSFHYATARFQGEDAPAEILAAAQAALAELAKHGEAPDAIAFIRGGGAVNDLAWLNDYHLARFICTAPVPVFTGIGHQRDSTLLDEVAHTAFDTPSKVIAGIEAVIARRAREAKDAFAQITAAARNLASDARAEAERRLALVLRASQGAAQSAGQRCATALADTRLHALGKVRRSAAQAANNHAAVREHAQLALAAAKQNVPALVQEIHGFAGARSREASREAHRQLAGVLERTANASRAAADRGAGYMQEMKAGAGAALRRAREATLGLYREVLGQGPGRTLARGFSLVRDCNGRPVTSVEAAAGETSLQIEFQDGTLPVVPKEK